MPSSAPADNLVALFTRPLDQLEISYMVSGSVAAIIYGEPRLTNDVDLIVDLDFKSARRVISAFPTPEFYCPPLDIIIAEMARDRRGHFNVIHVETGFKADFYLAGSDPLHASALARAKRLPVGSVTLMVAPLDYVIVRKLEYFREGGSEKHLRDIQVMLRNSGDQLQMEEFIRLIEERGITREWQRTRGAA